MRVGMRDSSVLTFEVGGRIKGANVGMVALDTCLTGNVGVAFHFALTTWIACFVFASLAYVVTS